MCKKSNTDGLDPNLPVLKGEKCESRLAKLWIDIMKSVCAKLKSSDKEPTHPTPNSGKAKSHHAKLRTNNNEPKDDTSRSGKSGSTRPMPNKGGTEPIAAKLCSSVEESRCRKSRRQQWPSMTYIHDKNTQTKSAHSKD